MFTNKWYDILTNTLFRYLMYINNCFNSDTFEKGINIISKTYICLPKSGSFSTVKSLTLGRVTDPIFRQHKLNKRMMPLNTIILLKYIQL